MAELEFFLLTATLNAVVVDYVDADDNPDIQPISGTIEFRPRIPTGKLVWVAGLTPPQGIALASVKARFDMDGVLRTIQNAAINELQRITVTGDPFTITYLDATTPDIAQGATAAQVETAIEALPTVGASNANVTGPDGGPYDVVFNDALGNQDITPMTATNATVETVRAGTLAAGVKLTANTDVLGLGTYDPASEKGGLVYDCIFTNVVYNKGPQDIHPFAFEAPAEGGGTVDLAALPKLPPAAGI